MPSEPGAVSKPRFRALLTKGTLTIALVGVGAASGAFCSRQPIPPVPSEWDNWNLVDPRTETPHQQPDVAAPKLGRNGQPHPPFITTHQWFLMQAKEKQPAVVFFGDSITEAWSAHPVPWKEAFGQYQPLNFGIGGDRIQHILWRIGHGELDGIAPKVVVLMAGTNNLLCDSSAEIAAGLRKVVELIRVKSPSAKVLLLAIFPLGEKPDAVRNKIDEVNALLAGLEDRQDIFFLDLGKKFLKSDGTLRQELMPDFQHPSAEGYLLWARELAPHLKTLTKE